MGMMLVRVTSSGFRLPFSFRLIVLCVSKDHSCGTVHQVRLGNLHQLHPKPHLACNTCLKLWPVHGHAWPMGAAPPAQVFLITGCLDALMQVSVEFMEPKVGDTFLR